MGFDKGRRGERGGRGRDKFDNFGDDGGFGGGGGDRFGGGGNRFGGGGDRFGGGGAGGGDRFGGGGAGGGGGGFRGGGGGGRPQMPAQIVGEGKGKVKFFNGQKGFGFISPDDGTPDIFVHISAVEQAGVAGLGDGQEVAFTMVDRGGRVSASDLRLEGEIIPVSDRGGDRPPPSGDRFGGGAGGGRFGDSRPPRAGGAGGAQRQLTGDKATGTVKFFNAMKGFGFVQRDDGQPDVFVHISAVERSGMSGLNEGDRIGFDIEVDGRGKYAAVNLTHEG